MAADRRRVQARRAAPDEIEPWRNLAAFWLLGLVNNSTYVIMIAAAKEISSGGVALVYLADIAPTFLVKLSAPYWFPYVHISVRAVLAALLMAASLLTVGLSRSLGWQLVGVGLCAIQSGLGESSILGLTSAYHGPSTITAWSSGTGFAGVMGYAWVVVLHTLMGLSFTTTLLLALLLPLGWCLVFFVLLEHPADSYRVIMEVVSSGFAEEDDDYDEEFSYSEEPLAVRRARSVERAYRARGARRHSRVAVSMTTRDKVRLLTGLWPYMVPLVVVYFAEYAMQSGTWSAIGFPIESEEARARFYGYANWCYQGGVFISRSSGLLIPPSIALLWIMPFLQLLLLIFFILDGVFHFWFSWSLLSLCFVVGLLGGAVYVSGFSLISRDTKEEFKEMAMVTASLADTQGIILSDVAGLLIQGCLYRANRLPGAVFKCGA